MRSVDLFEDLWNAAPRVRPSSRYGATGRPTFRSPVTPWRCTGLPRPPSGYGCRLGPHLQDKLATWLDEGPAAHGWVDDQVWTAARVRTLIGRTFHISYSVCGVTRLLHRMG
ncbi:winged helix-turn-helix domain-containing protein [Streptomyces sp. NPDC055105]|uniref:winged helix-turn-helix domain-containing protein n=1 Tax=Streptomyces sp. NPDC055105 TaxID=3365719 RepID=UPI0037CEE154